MPTSYSVAVSESPVVRHQLYLPSPRIDVEGYSATVLLITFEGEKIEREFKSDREVTRQS